MTNWRTNWDKDEAYLQKSNMSSLSKQRREYVNKEFGKAMTGKHLTNKQKSVALKKLWKTAKRKFK